MLFRSAIVMPEYDINYHKYSNGKKPDTLLLEKHLNLYDDFYKSLWDSNYEDTLNLQRISELNNEKEAA